MSANEQYIKKSSYWDRIKDIRQEIFNLNCQSEKEEKNLEQLNELNQVDDRTQVISAIKKTITEDKIKENTIYTRYLEAIFYNEDKSSNTEIEIVGFIDSTGHIHKFENTPEKPTIYTKKTLKEIRAAVRANQG